MTVTVEMPVWGGQADLGGYADPLPMTDFFLNQTPDLKDLC